MEKATLQDLILVLSAFGLRISRSSPGSKELMRSLKTKALIEKIVERICRDGMLKDAKYV
jgi:hypothetical protein